jgi:hypothetical protein
MPEQRLVDFVKSRMNAGQSAGMIKLSLLKAGWHEEDIDEAIRIASSEQEYTDSAPYKESTEITKEKSRKRIYIATIVIIVVILAITTIYISLLPGAEAKCGDGFCIQGETYLTCPADCPAPPRNVSGPLISVSPQKIVVNKGSIVVFDITLKSVSDLYGFQYDFAFDPSVLQFLNSTEGTFLNKNTPGSTFCIDPKSSSGSLKDYITVACTRLGDIGGASGSGTLTTIRLLAVNNGTSEIKLTNVKFVDASQKNIVADIENSLLTIK